MNCPWQFLLFTKDDGLSFGSKARQLVHEFAHESWGANRPRKYADEYYDFNAVESLAKSDPDYARNNADSYALYATVARTLIAPTATDAPATYFKGVQ